MVVLFQTTIKMGFYITGVPTWACLPSTTVCCCMCRKSTTVVTHKRTFGTTVHSFGFLDRHQCNGTVFSFIGHCRNGVMRAKTNAAEPFVQCIRLLLGEPCVVQSVFPVALVTHNNGGGGWGGGGDDGQF